MQMKMELEQADLTVQTHHPTASLCDEMPNLEILEKGANNDFYYSIFINFTSICENHGIYS